MSLKRNILASYVSQIYVTLIGILIFPQYLKYMGSEAYGLVGFFSMLQAWFGLLDLGLSSTVTRETARYKAGVVPAIRYLDLLRALQIFFLSTALVGGSVLFSLSGFIADNWLKVEATPIASVDTAIELMAVSVSLRWLSGFYRGCISGNERIAWLSVYNIFIATLRFVAVLPILIYVDTSPVVFFVYQLGVAIVELVGLISMAELLKPVISEGRHIEWSPRFVFEPILPVLRFSLGVAFSAIVWTMVTQVDKLILSKLLPLAEYGLFGLVVTVASVVLVASGPISLALLPRMALLGAKDNDQDLVRVYREATQAVSAIVFPVSILISVFSEQLLWIWIGDAEIAFRMAPVLSLYAAGNGVLAVGAFPYYLQYAKGDLRLHQIGNFCYLAFLVPALIYFTRNYGMRGAGWVWLLVNVVYFVFWVPVVHNRLLCYSHIRWLYSDVCAILVPNIVIALAFKVGISWPVTRGAGLAYMALLATVQLALSIAFSPVLRSGVTEAIKRLRSTLAA